MDTDNLLTLALLIGVVAAAGLAYTAASTSKVSLISQKDAQISELAQEVAAKENQIAVLQSKKPSSPAPEVVETPSPKEVETGDVDCLLCHDLSQTKSFHVPQTIMKIDSNKGKRRRVCVDCHGPDAYDADGTFIGWSADEQRTPTSDIVYDDSVGLNGVFDIPNSVPHSIHKMKLEAGEMKCQTCHGTGTKLVIPEADTASGQVLVCQNCKFHPEGGNYITIHVELGGLKCTVCHTGGIINVHRERTKLLGQVPQGFEGQSS